MHTVLLVEDNREIVGLLCDVLQEEGHRVATAYSCREAVACFLSYRPQVLVCDLMLPDGCSEQLCEYLFKTAQHQRIPTILMSANEPPPCEERWYDVFLAKPFDVYELADLIEQMAAPKQSAA